MTTIDDSVSNADGCARREWAQRINRTHRQNEQQTVRGHIETGKLIIAAREALPHGEFGRMIKRELLFSRRKAERLAVIAGHPILSNATHASHLPASWATLYELTQIDVTLLAEKLTDGTITPQLKRVDIQRKVLGEEKSKRSRGRLDRVLDLRRECDGLKAHAAELEAALEAARNLLSSPIEAPQLQASANSGARTGAIACVEQAHTPMYQRSGPEIRSSADLIDPESMANQINRLAPQAMYADAAAIADIAARVDWRYLEAVSRLLDEIRQAKQTADPYKTGTATR